MKLKLSGHQRLTETIKQKGKLALAISMGGFAIFTFIIFFTYNNVGITQTAIAAPGKDGAKTISSSNVILNEYTSLTIDASIGVNSISVGNACLNSNGRFPSNLSSGDLVMIIQMETAAINSAADTSPTPDFIDNTGNFEFAEVLNVPSASKIILKSGISKSYDCSGKVQVIRVPRFSSLKINSSGTVTVPDWDGTTGGVLAVEVNGETIIDGAIDVTGRGFTTSCQNKSCLQDDLKSISSNAFQNSSQFVNENPRSLNLYTRIFMGGGDDARYLNDAQIRNSGNGGGIVYLISYGKVSGSGIIEANGGNSDGIKRDTIYNKGSKLSGGCGGSVFIYSQGATVSNLRINAKGGNGISNNMQGLCENELIGGTGGTICITNNNSLKLDVRGGNFGISNLPQSVYSLPGIIALSPLNPYSSGGSLSVELLDFNGETKNGAIHLLWSTATEINNDFFTIEKSTDGLNFVGYGKIEGAGNTTVVQNYTYNDLKPSKGINYYRLKQTDFNGKYEYLKIITINIQITS